MTIRWIDLMLFGLLLAPCAFAAETPLRLSLRDALKMAQTRPVQVITAHERVQQAMARLGQAASTLLPQVSAGASQTRQTKNLEAAGIALPGANPLVGPFNSFDARIRVTQMLFDMTAIQRLRATRAARALSVAEYEKARQDAMALVAALYVEAQRAAQALEPAHALLARDAERLRMARARYDAGTGTPLELKAAEAALAERLHEWHAALAQATERRLDVAAALDLPARQPVVFVPEDDAVKRAADRDPSAEDLSQQPDVVVAERALRQREIERAAGLAEYLPKASASADYGLSGKDPSDSNTTYAVGAQVSMPMFEGGRKIFRTHELSGLVRESAARLTDAKQQAETNALSAMDSAAQAQILIEAADLQLAVALKQVGLAQDRKRTGLGSDLDVTEAFAQAAVAKDRRDEALAAFRMAQITVAHALGHVDAMVNEVPGP